MIPLAQGVGLEFELNDDGEDIQQKHLRIKSALPSLFAGLTRRDGKLYAAVYQHPSRAETIRLRAIAVNLMVPNA